MADQAGVTRWLMHAAVESAGPDMVADVVKAHAVGAADQHAAGVNLRRHAAMEKRCGVTVHV